MKKQGVFRLILLGIFLVVPLLFVPILVEQYEFPKLSVMWAGVALLLSVVPWQWPKNDKIALGLVIFTVSTLISTVFSLNLRISLFGNPVSPNGVTTSLGYLGLYLVTRTLLSNGQLGWKFLLWNTLPAAISAGYALFQFFGHDFIVWQGQLIEHGALRPGGTLGQPDFLGSYLVMGFFIVLSTREKWATWLRWGLLALLASAIIVTRSRGAWGALFVGWLAWLWFVDRVRFSRLTPYFSLAIPAVILAKPLAATINVDRWPGIWSVCARMASMFDLSGSRAGYLKGAWRIWQRYPWFGAGTDTFQLAFEHQRTAYFWHVAPGETPHRAHNEVLNVLATQGIFGLLALGLLVWFVFCALTKLQRGSGYHGLLVALLVSFAIQGLSSFTIVTTGIVAIVTLALIANEILPALQPSTSKLKTAVALAFTCLTITLITMRALGSFHEKLALQFEHVAPMFALVEAENAVVFQHGDESFVTFVGQVAEGIYSQTRDPRYISLALRGAVRAVQLNPQQPFNHFMLAVILRQVGRLDLAAMEFQAALNLEPNNPVYMKRGL